MVLLLVKLGKSLGFCENGLVSTIFAIGSYACSVNCLVGLLLHALLKRFKSSLLVRLRIYDKVLTVNVHLRLCFFLEHLRLLSLLGNLTDS